MTQQKIFGVLELVPIIKFSDHFVGNQFYSFLRYVLSAILFLLAVVAFCNQAIAQSQSGQGSTKKKGPFFYGTVVVWPEFHEFYPDGRDSYKGGRRQVMFGLHPTDASIAQKAACIQLDPSARNSGPPYDAYRIVFEQCNDFAGAARCGNGRYFSVARTDIEVGSIVDKRGNAFPQRANVAGIACGALSLKEAQEKAIANCNKARAKQGHPLVQELSQFDKDIYAAGPPWQHNCRTDISGLNDGTYAGKVVNIDRQLDKNQFWQFRRECWGNERVADPFLVKSEWLSRCE